uniref:lysylphosphatidylglycerol synthase transmembrane domain-containing protein n=1 Tax=Eubacterium cellulosolvens TaxID=29322 RepID=UPI000686FF6F|nr:lysylphosphatidylglycerol synthase transmembrane domain-containing protein [[Eubacterium] cellulosolvens]
MNKKKVMWALISAVLAVLTIITIFSQNKNLSLQMVMDALHEADRKWLIPAVLSMLGFIVFEGEAILSILRQIGYPRKQKDGLVFAAGDVYFSAITPSASGGQPASAFFMMRSGIPGSVVTAVLLLNLVMYTLGILTVGAFCMIAAPQIFFHFSIVSRVLIGLGLLVLVLLAVAFFMLLVRIDILENLGRKGICLLHKLHLLRHPEAKLKRLTNAMEEYEDCVRQMRGHKRAFLSAYFWNLLQRVSQICVSMFMFLATGGKWKDAFSIWVTQSFVAIGSNCVPIPGGMGAADYLMIDGFRQLMSDTAAARLELLSRSLSFYICVMVSGLIVAIGYFVCKTADKKRERKQLAK